MENGQLYDSLVDTFNNGYYNYSFVINFKPDGPYDSLHPKEAHRKFKETFEKYFRRRGKYSFICFPELSDAGKYHIHGLIFHKESDYDKHEKAIRLIKNWMRRTFGWNAFQRIHHMQAEYKTTDLRCLKTGMWTNFAKVWKYITKDVDKYKFLKFFAVFDPLH